MTDPESVLVVLTDTNILINFLHLDRLDLLGRIPGYHFQVPDHVVEEIHDRQQRERLEAGLQSGFITVLSITDLEEIESYAQFHRSLGQGEAACLAVAVRRGYCVASDDRRLFRKAVVKGIGKERILTTKDLIVLAIRAGLATVEDADEWKLTLETRRFKMRFTSFREVL